MKKMTIETVREAVGGEIIQGSGKNFVTGVSHDSRSIGEGDLFFAIKGDNFDGHRFIKDAVKAGTKCFVVSHMDWAEGIDTGGLDLIMTDDTRKALADLAAFYLKDLGITTIGVTGSTGKTSTKDMLYYVCSQKYRTGRTEGNFNNDIGMPLTVLGFDPDIEVAVLEMGMDHFGEIDELARIARPKIGLITNIGISHLENLGSREGIMRAKMEITDYFDETNTLIISTGKDLLRRENISGPYRLITTGTEDGDDYRVRDIKNTKEGGISFFLLHDGRQQEFKLPVAGRHNALNAAMAATCGGIMGISMEQAAEGLSHMELTGGRLSMKHNGDLTVIDDTYNASPDSMKSGIDVLCSISGKRHIAVLGDMFELGRDTKEWHRKVGEYASAKDVEKVYAIGDNARYIAEGAGEKGVYFKKKEDFLEKLPEIIENDDAVLVKGSRGMAMEKITEALMKPERE